MKELTVEADADRAADVTDFIAERLKAIGCSADTAAQICIAADEIFSNIANYAYRVENGFGAGTATIRVETEREAAAEAVVITFSDSGIRFDPLAVREPDITLPAEKRAIGGLGIYLVKRIMNGVSYEYRDGKNILTMRKILK